MAVASHAGLPYGRFVSRLLRPLHGAFLRVNRMFVPALDAGLSPLFSNPATGYLMVLRTRGRRSGLPREAPLGYVIREGAIYCCAGFGEATAWYRNLLADPAVEVVLPGRTVTGVASPVVDPAEWVRAYRALIGSLGIVGRLTVGEIGTLDDDALLAAHGAIPVIRITAEDLAAGPMDPGGRFWLVPWVGSLAVATLVWLQLRRAGRRRVIEHGYTGL